MKNLTVNLSTLIILGFLALFSCKKETQTFDPKFEPQISNDYFGENIITSSVGGVIRDENGNGVANATVKIDNNTMQTDVNGVFLFKDIRVNAKRTYVKVSKNGFFHGSRSLYPSANAVEYVNVTLLESSSKGSFASSSGGIISSNGVKLDFPANSVKIEGGGIYSGTVNVAIKFLDPTSDQMPVQMPGDLMAVNTSNQLRMLETYGMAAVELTSPTGQKLNVADGKKVGLTIPLSGPYLTDAPSSIPLWYFDEDNGIWKEEGSATKVGNEYVGEVSHFSFWNADFQGDRVFVTGSILCGSSPVANSYVYLQNSSGRYLGYGMTNHLGVFSGFVGANTIITITIKSPYSCSGNIIYTGTIGPFSTTTTIPTIDACNSSSSYTGILTAKLLDCSGSAINNGMLEAKIGFSSSYFFPNSIGQINTGIIFCTNSTIDIQGYDYINSKSSSVQTISTGATMNAGNISVCGAIDEYIHYNLDGTNYKVDKIPGNSLSHSSTGTNTSVWGYNGTLFNSIQLEFLGASVGTFSANTNNFHINNFGSLATGNTVSANFTQYGTTPGTYKIGTFSGNFIDSLSTSHTLSGSFRLKNP